ncbi:MAG: hypothetical protein JSW73_03895 [Candidatus Woesearchaeota archaeon]|nr:MAG: hypothetical protein JSW73_03895 [Candidatus Woesearchaeota archaeon]
MESGRVLEKVLEEYDDEPDNWKVLVGFDDKHHFVMYFFHYESLWILKKNAYSNYKDDFVGNKVEVKSNDMIKYIKKRLYTFGYRSGDPNKIMQDILNGCNSKYLAKKYSPKSREECFGAKDYGHIPLIGCVTNVPINTHIPTIYPKIQTKMDERIKERVDKSKVSDMFG